MISICFKYLCKKKCDVAIIIIATFLLSVISLLILFKVNDICCNKEEEGRNLYGSYKVGGVTEDIKDIDNLRTNKNIKLGVCDIKGEVYGKGLALTVGSMDELFMQHCSCKVIEGKKPVKENEIAIQKFAMNTLNIKGVGDSVDLILDGIKKTYIVTGILNNYSCTLNIDPDKKNYKNYPVICVNKNIGRTKYYSYLIDSYKDYKGTDYSSLINNMGVDDDYIMYTNDNLINETILYCNVLKNASKVFVVLVFFVGVLICICTFRIIYKNLAYDISILNVLGITKKKKIFLLIIQVLMITLPSFVLSVISLNILINKDIIMKNMFFTLIWYFCYDFLLILYLIFYLRNLKDDSFKMSVASYVKKYPLNEKNILKKIYSVKWTGVIKYICISVMYLGCINLILSLREVYIYDSDYTLISNQIDVRSECNNFIIRDYNINSYSFDDVEKLIDNNDGIRVNKRVCVDSDAQLLLNKNVKDSLLDSWIINHNYEDTDKIELPNEAKSYKVVRDVDYILLSGDEYYKLVSGANDNGIILYLPFLNKIESDTISNLSIGGIIKNNSSYEFVDYDINIDKVCYKDYGKIIKKNSGDVSLEYFDEDMITIFLNEDVIKNYGFIHGYDELVINIVDDDTDVGFLDDSINDIQAAMQGGNMISKDFENKDKSYYNNYITLIGVAMMIMVFVLSVIYTICDVILSIKSDKKNIGIFQIIGGTYKNINRRKVISEFLNVWYGILILILITLIKMYGVYEINEIIITVIVLIILNIIIFLLSVFSYNSIMSKISIRRKINGGMI